MTWAERAARRIMQDHTGNPHAADEDPKHVEWIVQVIEEEMRRKIEVKPLLYQMRDKLDCGCFPEGTCKGHRASEVRE